MSTIILVVIAATALTVFGTPSYMKTPWSSDVLTERIQHRLPSYSVSALNFGNRSLKIFRQHSQSHVLIFVLYSAYYTGCEDTDDCQDRRPRTMALLCETK